MYGVDGTKRIRRLICLGLLGTPIYAVNFRFSGLLRRANLIAYGENFYTSFLWQFLILVILYLAALRIVFRTRDESGSRGRVLFVIVFFAILYRSLLVPTNPVLSSDLYRYIWDGRVQARGVNPYLFAPDNKALESLRDEAVYPFINRPGSPTIYPAGAQLLFRGLNRLGITNIYAFKGAVVLFDVASILVLILILTNLGLPRERVLAYAWHPLVIYELGNSGHIDGFMLLFFLLALLFMIKKRSTLSISSLALAASLKLYPAVVLPALLKEKKIRGCILFGIVLASLYLPYLDAGKGIAGFLPEYFENPDEAFNLGLKAYILKLFPAAYPMLVTMLFGVVLVAAAAVVWLRRKDTVSALRFAYILAGLHLVLASGSFQPWYLIWIVPFLALFPSPAWLYFSFAVSLSYLAYVSGGYSVDEWVRNIEYLPFFALLSVEYFVLFRPSGNRFPWRPSKEATPQTSTESVSQ